MNNITFTFTADKLSHVNIVEQIDNKVRELTGIDSDAPSWGVIDFDGTVIDYLPEGGKLDEYEIVVYEN